MLSKKKKKHFTRCPILWELIFITADLVKIQKYVDAFQSSLLYQYN